MTNPVKILLGNLKTILSFGSSNPNKNVVTDANGNLKIEDKNNHNHGQIDKDGKVSTTTSTVGNVVVTDSSNVIKAINKLPAANVTHQDISGKENISNKVKSNSSLNINNTDDEYPSAKLIYNTLNSYIPKTSNDTGFVKSNGNVTGFGVQAGTVAEGNHSHSLANGTVSGFSTNDFTNDLKQKLTNLPTKSQLDLMIDASFTTYVVQTFDFQDMKSRLGSVMNNDLAGGYGFYYYIYRELTNELSIDELDLNTIYLVPNDLTEAPDIGFYHEFIIIPYGNGIRSEKIGTTQIDLSNYVQTNELLDLIYPVGSIYLSVTNSNPAVLFGGGVWERIEDTFLLSSGSTYSATYDDDGFADNTGGNSSVTLTISEIPSHNHTQNSHTHTQDAHNHSQNAHSHRLNNSAIVYNGNASGQIPNGNAKKYTTNSGNNVGTDNATASNNATTATNQSTIATNQSTTATNKSTTATNIATTATNIATTATNQSTTATNNPTGGDAQGNTVAHNNMPPYLVVNVWKRVE